MVNKIKKIFFKKRIPEPEIMEKIEYLDFQRIFLQNYYQWTVPILEDIKKYFNENGKYNILDVACGPGYLTKELSLNFKKSVIYGLDHSRYVINLAKNNCKNIKNINFIVNNINNTKFNNDFFDLIICKDSLHHFKNINLALKEMLRILKKDGTIYIQDLRRDTPWYILKTILPPDNNVKKLIYYSVRASYTKEEILDILNKNNIENFIFKIRKVDNKILNIFKKNKINADIKKLNQTFRSRFILIIKK